MPPLFGTQLWEMWLREPSTHHVQSWSCDEKGPGAGFGLSLLVLRESEMEALAVLVIILMAIAYFLTRLIFLSNIGRRGKDKEDQTD